LHSACFRCHPWLSVSAPRVSTGPAAAAASARKHKRRRMRRRSIGCPSRRAGATASYSRASRRERSTLTL
jgi:hypothetical protein